MFALYEKLLTAVPGLMIKLIRTNVSIIVLITLLAIGLQSPAYAVNRRTRTVANGEAPCSLVELAEGIHSQQGQIHDSISRLIMERLLHKNSFSEQISIKRTH